MCTRREREERETDRQRDYSYIHVRVNTMYALYSWIYNCLHVVCIPLATNTIR